MIQFRRKRQGKTDYKKRLRLLSSRKLRLVVRKTNKNVIVQIIEFKPEGDDVVVSAHSNELKKHGWRCAKRNLPAAYLTGLLCGLKAKKANIKEAVLDIGMVPAIKGSLVYAALKGAIDSGLEVPHSKEVLPSDDRLSGKHIGSNTVTKFTRFDAKDVAKNFEEVKNKIVKGA